MGLVNKCCFFVDLRVGCIVMAVVTAILSIIMSVYVTKISGYVAIPFCILGSAGLIFAALYVQGTTQQRTIGVIVYLVTTLLCVFLSIIGMIVLWVDWGRASQAINNIPSSPFNSNPYNIPHSPYNIPHSPYNNNHLADAADSVMTTIHKKGALRTVFGLIWIVLELYFALVAFGFYQLLNEAKPNDVTPA